VKWDRERIITVTSGKSIVLGSFDSCRYHGITVLNNLFPYDYTIIVILICELGL
jgi:hypothetical protein